MKLQIENPNLKIWNKVVHMLSSTGNEQDIHFIITDGTATLSAYDETLITCVTCSFFSNFFIKFEVPRETELDFTIPAKCILKPFRSMRFLTKCSNFCEILFDDETQNTIEVVVGCKSGAEIRYTIKKNNTEVLEVTSDPKDYKNILRVDAKLLLGGLTNFSHNKGVSNLTVKIDKNKMVLKSSAKDVVKRDGKIYTEFSLNAVDFDDYDVTQECEMTLPLKDLKMFTALADHLKIPLYIFFQGPLDPAIIQIQSDTFQATMTLAARANPESNPASSQVSNSSNGRISNVSSQGSAAKNDHEVLVGNSHQQVGDNNLGVSRIQENAARKDVPESPIKSLVISQPTRTETPSSVVFESPIMSNPRAENAKRMLESIEGPPRKKLRDLFPNLGQPFDIYKAFPGHDVVLVADSDEEDLQLEDNQLPV